MRVINEYLLNKHVDIAELCITYNQENYISNCIEGMLSQEGNYSSYILIHDDCSTDSTGVIVEEYANRYPDRIVAFFESENQFSQGILPTEIMMKYIDASYIAICEGDDWWSDPKKLDKQFKVFCEDPHCSMCAHEVWQFDDSRQTVVGRVGPSEFNRYYSIEEIIQGDGGLFGTCSVMVRADCCLLEGVYKGWGIGDYPRAIKCAMNGSVFYIAEPMSNYRINSSGSWSNTQLLDFKKSGNRRQQIIAGLESFNEATNFQYTKEVERVISRNRYIIALSEGSLRKLLSDDCRLERTSLPFGQFAKDVIKCIAPQTYNMYLKRKIGKRL